MKNRRCVFQDRAYTRTIDLYSIFVWQIGSFQLSYYKASFQNHTCNVFVPFQTISGDHTQNFWMVDNINISVIDRNRCKIKELRTGVLRVKSI